MARSERVPGSRRLLHGRPFDGPPPALPAVLDVVSERWWRLKPRVRAWIVVAAVLGLVSAGIGHVAASPWGAPVTVLVAAADLDIGRSLQPGDVRRTSWPSELVPSGALTEVAGIVMAPVPAGAVVTDRHVGDGGLGAAVPTGHVAVPLPVELLPDLPRGARLDLVGSDVDARGVTLARAALVLATDGAHVWVTVEHEAASDVAAAATGGRLTAVLLPQP